MYKGLHAYSVIINGSLAHILLTSCIKSIGYEPGDAPKRTLNNEPFIHSNLHESETNNKQTMHLQVRIIYNETYQGQSNKAKSPSNAHTHKTCTQTHMIRNTRRKNLRHKYLRQNRGRVTSIQSWLSQTISEPRIKSSNQEPYRYRSLDTAQYILRSLQ